MTANPLAWPFRAQMLFGAVACAALIGYALYVEKHMLMMPCPLCILQRVAIIAVGFVGLVGALHGPKSAGGRRAYGVLAFLAAAAGAFVAGRHLWIQSLPPDLVPTCNSMGIDYMLDAMPVLDVLRTILTGSGECAKVDWTLFGLSMPGWTLVCFVLLGLGALYAGFRKRG
jgi:disulfide bond formation protein DsbB